jgi:DNA-directed RNA polymerase subunit RPC12/RpoP
MAGTMNFKRPSCGAYLEFDPGKNAFACGYCGSEFSEAQLREFSASQQQEAEKENREKESRGGRLKEYHCANCGAQIVTGETTAATRCYFCHNPVVISDRVTAGYTPDGVIPFVLTEDEAKEFISLWDKAGAIQKLFGGAVSQYNNICLMTPNQLLTEGYKEADNFKTYEQWLTGEIKASHEKRWKNAKHAAEAEAKKEAEKNKK